MKQIVLSLILLGLILGCESTSVEQVNFDKSYTYQKIWVMPFTQGDPVLQNNAQQVFRQELSTFAEIEIFPKDPDDSSFIMQSGISHPDSLGPVDFTETPEGNSRRKLLESLYDIDAVIFGSVFEEKDEVYLYIQMLDVKEGQLVQSFSQQQKIKGNQDKDTMSSLPRLCAQKVIDHIKENWVGTYIHRY